LIIVILITLFCSYSVIGMVDQLTSYFN